MTKNRDYYAETRHVLRELGIPVHRMGHRLLCEAIPRYAGSLGQMLGKELYPELAKALGFPNSGCVERNMRYAIVTAWKCRDTAVWERYFPRCGKAPSNLLFIATLADRMKQ